MKPLHGVYALALVCALLPISAARAASASDDEVLPAEERPYVFTQVHRDALPWWRGTWRPQSVDLGRRIEVQLPGEPTAWRRVEPCAPTAPEGAAGREPRGDLRFLGRRLIPSPNRITGTASITQFAYVSKAPGVVAICLEASPPSPSNLSEGARLGPASRFVLTLRVVEP